MCFSLSWIMNLLIWAVIIGAVFALVKLLLPVALGPLGQPGAILVQAINIIIWTIIIIFVIYIIFELISCLLGSGGLRSPLPR